MRETPAHPTRRQIPTERSSRRAGLAIAALLLGGGHGELVSPSRVREGRRLSRRQRLHQGLHVYFGGSCTGGCNDNYSKAFIATPDWQAFTFRFSDLAQRGFGTPTTLDLSAITDFHWNVGAGVDFDLYIDDVSFIR